MEVAEAIQDERAVNLISTQALFNESLNGLPTLRSFDGAFARFAQRFAGLVDRTNSAELHLAALSYWLSVRLNALGSTVAGSTALALYAQSAGCVEIKFRCASRIRLKHKLHIIDARCIRLTG